MTRRTLPLIFLAALTLTSCEEGGNEESLDNTEPPIDATTPCGGACLHLFDCLGEICSAEVVGQVVDLAGCVADCEADPDFEPGQLSDLSCTGVNLGVCQSNPQLAAFGCACPGLQSNETNIGDACLNDFDCETGDLQGGCIPGVDPESGEETGFPGGYCTADACLNDAACGEGNFCVPTPRSDTLVNSCLSGCDPSAGRAGCREGYGCWILKGSTTEGVCFPECSGDDICCEEGDLDCDAFCDTEGTGACAP